MNVPTKGTQQITIDGAIPREIKILPQAGIVQVRLILGESDGANGLAAVHDKANATLSGADYDAIAAAQATFISAVMAQLSSAGDLPAGSAS
jgi:hypothetical protein